MKKRFLVSGLLSVAIYLLVAPAVPAQEDKAPAFGGIKLPDFPASLDNFDPGQFMESISVSKDMGPLTLEDKKALRTICLQIYAVAKTALHKDSTFSIKAPIWRIIEQNFDEVKNPKFNASLIRDGRVSLYELASCLSGGRQPIGGQ